MGNQSKLRVEQAPTFARWLDQLKDTRARARILTRILRLEDGSWGDVRVLGDSLFELRVMVGPGYRLYGTRMEGTVVMLLCGGDKGSQNRDVEKAKRLAEKVREERSGYEESL